MELIIGIEAFGRLASRWHAEQFESYVRQRGVGDIAENRPNHNLVQPIPIHDTHMKDGIDNSGVVKPLPVNKHLHQRGGGAADQVGVMGTNTGVRGRRQYFDLVDHPSRQE
jgi:hypothetical protein